MSAPSWIVGTAPDCDVRIVDPTVSGRHCRLTPQGDAFLLEDLRSTNGTRLGDEPITTPQVVRRGDRILLGTRTPLPWSEVPVAITIGRAPDNDLVIPIDAVSSYHARLERRGEQTLLIDLNSTNGTAVNDPLKKIEQARIRPGDFVFFGTHRVAAGDLLAALPDVRPANGTILVAPDERVRQPEKDSSGSPAAMTSDDWLASFRSGRSWVIGTGLSVLVAATIFGTQRIRAPQEHAVDESTPKAASVVEPTGGATPRASDASLPASLPRRRQPPSEATIRAHESAIAVVGIRLDSVTVLTDDTAWAVRPDAVVCRKSIADRLEGLRKTGDAREETLAVRTPQSTMSVLERKDGIGPASAFSLLQLESPLDAVCPIADQAGQQVAPGQQLAALSGASKDHDPDTVHRAFALLSIDRIERTPDKSPLRYHCTVAPSAVSVGAPVFNDAGAVVGVVEAVVGSTASIVPIRQLVSLISGP